MKFIITFIFLFGALFASGYKEVFNKNLNLGKNFSVNLKLLEEDSDMAATKSAIIKVTYPTKEGNKEFVFSQKDNDANPQWPIFYFHDPKLIKEIKKFTKLSSIALIDLDKDGYKEIIIYGGSHYDGSGYVGKLVIVGKSEDKFGLKAPIIKGYDNFNFYYFKDLNLIVVSQYIWRVGKEGHYGDKHKYFIDVYEVENNFNKINLMVTKKKYSDEGLPVAFILKDKIVKKYIDYKLHKPSEAKEKKIKQFVKKYWREVSKKNYEFIKNSFAKEAFYYSRVLPKSKILQDKKRVLKNVKNVKFKVNRFLIYKKNGNYIVEYKKKFKVDNQKGKVISFMKLKEGKNGFKILAEKDLAIIELFNDM